MSSPKAGRKENLTSMTMLKISAVFLLVYSVFKSTPGYSAVAVSSAVSAATAWADVLNPILEMGVSMSAIVVSIVTVLHYRRKSKEADKD